ncbi:MAG: hypothetical protein U5K56_00295 [Halioglobus sp.]|nr:hypothetical protein [Halioglobus sp.]
MLFGSAQIVGAQVTRIRVVNRVRTIGADGCVKHLHQNGAAIQALCALPY